MSEQDDRNRSVIKDFRANGGKVGGRSNDLPLLLLTTTGAKTGQVRTNPVGYLADGDRLFVFASKGGGPTSPDWYHNLVAHPNVRVELGTESFEALATVLSGEERDQVYARQAALHPNFAEYQQRTKRTIPVVALTRVS